MENKISLGIEGFSLVDEVSDEQFALVEVYVCHDGNNAHNMPISLNVIKQAKKTLKNKFLVAGYDGEDFEGHEPDEQIVGFFPESSKMTFKKKNGKTYLVAQAIMSKVYAQWAYDIFLEDNHRDVSMEIIVTKSEEDENGFTHILEFVFSGVTLLGKSHLPACQGADATITKFSIEDASAMYNKCSSKSRKIKEEFVKEIGFNEDLGKEEKSMKDEKEKEVKSEIKEEEDGKATMEDKEEKSEDEEKEEKMEDKDESEDEEKENDKEKKFDDEDEDDEDDDEEDDSDDNKDEEDDKENKEEAEDSKDAKKEDKKFESLTAEQKYEVFHTAIREKHIDGYLETYDDEYIYVYKWEDQNVYRYSYTLNETTVEIADEGERVMRGGYITFSEDEDVETPEEKIEKLENEVAELKELCNKYEEKEKEDKVEKVLSTVRDDVDSEKLDELREKAMSYSLSEIDAFENEVKALAFESVKNKAGKYSFNRVAIVNNDNIPSSSKYSW